MTKRWIRWTEEEIALLLSDYRQALSLEEIAVKHDRSRWSVVGQLKRLEQQNRLPARTHRYCSRCEQRLPVEKFAPSAQNEAQRRARVHYCTACNTEYYRQRRSKKEIND